MCQNYPKLYYLYLELLLSQRIVIFRILSTSIPKITYIEASRSILTCPLLFVLLAHFECHCFSNRDLLSIASEKVLPSRHDSHDVT